MYIAAWLVAFVVLIVIELLTMGLTTIWFAGGALIALLMAFLGFNLVVQMVVFLLISGILLVMTRPIAMKYFNKDRQRTNAESLLGQTALVLEEIDNIHGTGKVEVNGMEWTARSKDEQTIIQKDVTVRIEDIQGVKLIVTENSGL